MNNFNEQLDKALNTWGAPKEALAEIVASYQNNELGSGSTQESGSSCNCDENLNSMQLQIEALTASVNETTEKLNLLLNKLYDRNAIYNTAYNPIDTSVVFRTYDFIEKELNLSTTSSITTSALGLFCLNGLEATVRLSLKVTATTTPTSGSVVFYLNGTSFKTFTLNEINLTTSSFDFTFDVPFSQNGNLFEAIVYTTNSNPINISYIKYEVYNCTNPTFVKSNTSYNVDYYNGKYYVTDCSGKTAKYAIAPVETFNSINDLVWIDTGIEATNYRFIGNLIQSGSVYVPNDTVSYFYIAKDYNLHLFDAVNNCEYTFKVINADPVNQRNNEINILNTAMYGQTVYTETNMFKDGKAKTTSYFNTSSKYCLVYAPKYMVDQVSSIIDRKAFILHTTYNEIEISWNSIRCYMGYGEYLSSYITNSNPVTIEAYVKVKNEVVKNTAVYGTSGSKTVLNSHTTEVIGNYDLFFKGVKNDYFTVVDGVLNYYQNDLLTENT